MTLVEFLHARLNDDEQTARAAKPGPWKAVPVTYGPGEPTDVYEVESTQPLDWPTVVSHQTYEGGGTDKVNAEHIARHHPKRTLAEVDAKRRLLDLHSAEEGQHPDFCWHDKHELPCPTLRLLALPYAGRPDYDPAWRP